MKNKLIILTSVILIMTFLPDCFPQNKDSLQKGSFYSITLVSGKTVKGKVMSADSGYVLLKTKQGLNEIETHNILNSKKLGQEFYDEYFTENRKPVYRNCISLSIGYISPSEISDISYNYYDYSNVNLNNGISVSAAYSGFFSRTIGVRAGLTYSRMSNKDDYIMNYNYFGTGSSFRKGGRLSQFTIGMDMLTGMLQPEKKINAYGTAGFGLGVANCGVVSEVYDGGKYDYNPDPQFLFSYGIGAGITYRFSEKTAFQTEAYYNHVSLQEGFYRDMDQFIIRAGIVFYKF